MSMIGKSTVTESRRVVARSWEAWGMGNNGFNMYGVSFGSDENVLELHSGDGCTIL